MQKNRLEAFSDGVMAIIITIMVLELKVPRGADLDALKPLFPVFLAYVLSFVYVGIYWNNHHHLFQLTKHVSAGMLWANLNLLFWLSLLPFVTAWTGANRTAFLPTAAYGVVLFMAAVSYYVLQATIKAAQGSKSILAAALGRDLKGKLSILVFVVAIPAALINPWITHLIYISVAMLWVIPDRRIERVLRTHAGTEPQ